MLQVTTFEDLASGAETLAGKRHDFLAAASAMETEVTDVRKRHMPQLRELALSVKSLTDNLLALVKMSPSLFEKPKSRTVSDIQYGYRMGRGRIEFDDEDKVIARIRKLRPDLVKTAIVTKETIDKDVISGLEGDELRKLGISITAAGNRPFVKAKSDELDALIAMALGEDGK